MSFVNGKHSLSSPPQHALSPSCCFTVLHLRSEIAGSSRYSSRFLPARVPRTSGLAEQASAAASSRCLRRLTWMPMPTIPDLSSASRLGPPPEGSPWSARQQARRLFYLRVGRVISEMPTTPTHCQTGHVLLGCASRSGESDTVSALLHWLATKTLLLFNSDDCSCIVL